VLYSGGKDSTLAALILAEFYDVGLVTGHFGVTDDHEHARRAADLLAFPFELVELDRSVAREAADRIHEDGYPNEGIEHVHEYALEVVAGLDVAAVADGTRRDDRTPTVDPATARSLEDRHGVDYVAPLRGFGHGAVDRLVDVALEVERGPSESVGRADYEAELRALLREEYGDGAVEAVFPDHEQTRVVGVADR